jgi:hypothetical protein
LTIDEAAREGSAERDATPRSGGQLGVEVVPRRNAAPDQFLLLALQSCQGALLALSLGVIGGLPGRCQSSQMALTPLAKFVRQFAVAGSQGGGKFVLQSSQGFDFHLHKEPQALMDTQRAG